MPERRGRLVLGFDFGLRRIGVASGDTISATAAPCATVRVTPQGIDWGAIARLLKQFEPDVLIVGSPRHADGSQSPRSAAADRFASELTARFAVPVERSDEFGSSIEATAALKRARAQGIRRRRVRHADIDGAAAAIIVERWMHEDAQGLRQGQ